MTIGLSPAKTHTDREQLDWAAACQAIAIGKKVTRLEWGNADICVFLHAGVLHLRKADTSLHTLLVSEGDIVATDWMVIRQQ